MLRHLENQVPRLVADGRVGDGERVEDGGQLAVGELDVDDGPMTCVMRPLLGMVRYYPFRASAPETISISSVVIAAWRARFIDRVRRSIISDGVAGGVVHRGHPRAELARDRLEQRLQ